MFTDAEAESIYRELASILEKHELGWVVGQVKEQVRFGKVEEVEVEIDEREDVLGPLFGGREEPIRPGTPRRRPRRGSKLTLTKTMPYSPHERLQVMVEAIEEVAVHTLELEKAIVSYAMSDAEAPKEVSFQPEELDESKSFSIDPSTFAARIEHARHLSDLLQEIRAEGSLQVVTDAS